MFIQVIQAKAGDPGGIRKEMDRWIEELAPGAEGALGATAGISEDGEYWSVVRFESEEAARKNSDRPEQGQWWDEFSKHLDGEATFYEGSDIETIAEGGSDEAGFVQIMKGRAKDLDKMRHEMREMRDQIRERRPDVIGGTSLRIGQNEFITTMYFTSEAEARKGEQAAAGAGEQRGPDWDEIVEEIRFIDLKEPWLFSSK